MPRHVRENKDYKEESLFESISDISWGINTKTKLKIQGEEKPTNVFVPLYPVLGESFREVAINSFAMKFYKLDNQNKDDLALIKLKILTTVTEEVDNWNESEYDENVDYNVEFHVESIKGISKIDLKENNEVRIYFTLKYLPEVFQTKRIYNDDSRQRYENETRRIRSPFWTENLLKNCLNNHLLFRVEGVINPKNESKFNTEFSAILNTSGISYVEIPNEKELTMKKNLLNFINGEGKYEEFTSKLQSLPFSTQYIFYCLICHKYLHILSHSYEELKEFIDCLYFFCYSEEDKENREELELALQKFRSSE